MKKATARSGQVLIEWVLLVAIAVVIFGSIFLVVRQNLFSVWICQYWPRVASPSECADETKCWESLKQGATSSDVAGIEAIRNTYCQ